MREVIEQLKQLRASENQVNPGSDWVAENRARLLAQIGNTVARAEHNKNGREDFAYRLRETFFVIKTTPAMRVFKPALTALVVAIVAMSGWIASVSASFNSIPGDKLWTVKRAAQKTEMAVKSIVASEQEKAELHLRLAKNRAEDIKKAVQKSVAEKLSLIDGAVVSAKDQVAAKEKKEKTEKDLTVAARDLAQAVQSASVVANEQVKNAAKQDPKGAVELVKDVTKNNGEIIKSLKETVVEVGTSAPAVTREVIETVKSVNNSTLSTVEAVVNASSTIIGVEGAAVKSIVSDKLAEITQTAKDMKQSMEIVKDAIVIAEAGTSASTASTTHALSPVNKLQPALVSSSLKIGVPNAVSATSGLVVDILVASSTIRENASSTSALFNKVKEAEAQTTVMQESIGEIKKNIDAGNLQEAVSRLKGLNETAGTAEKLIVETKKQIFDINIRN